MMSYRAIFYLLCVTALLLGSGIVSADDLFPFDEIEFLDDVQEFFSTIFDFEESTSIEVLQNTSEVDEELTEEDLILLEEIFANTSTNEVEIQDAQDPFFSTILDLEESMSMEDFLNTSQIDLFPFDEMELSDDFQDLSFTALDFDESISVEDFLSSSQIEEELTEEDLILLEAFFANDVISETEIQDVQESFFSTIFDFEEFISVEEFLNNSEIDVELTQGDLVLVEAVFASALTSEIEIQEFEAPIQVEEELPIAPTSLAVEEIPMLMGQFAAVNQDSVTVWPNIGMQGGFSAAAASTIVYGSSAIMGGFSNIQFVSSFFTSGFPVFHSHFFSNPFHTYPTIATSTRMTLTVFPQNPRPGEYLTLVGKLQDQFGRPIAGAQVRIIKTDERGRVAGIGTARTDFAGNYVFRTIATPGVYWYRSEYLQRSGFAPRGYSNAVRVTSISYQNWEVALTAMPTTSNIGDKILLYGLVLSDGYPVGSGRLVELQYQHGGRWYRIAQRQTDAQGVFSYPLQATAPGTIIVRALFYDPYGVQKVSNSVTLNIIGYSRPLPGNTGLTLYAQSQNLPSHGSTTVYGWLSTSSGMPLAGMPIVIQSTMQQGSGDMRTTEFRNTNADGSFELPIVASEGSGTITVQASFQGSGQFGAAESRPLTINFGRPGPIRTTPSPVNRQVQITAQYSPTNPQVGEDTIVTGRLTTITGDPVSGVLITGHATIKSGICQSTSRNSVNTDMNGNYRYTFQPSCEGEAQVTIGFDGTAQYQPVSVSFKVPVGRSRPIPMDPIVMMSAP